ncbi:MAG: ribonucleoside-diphosphate reductase alpha chain [Candidatus Berkelbacteria bacterium Licking1014_85]|uniref:Ribonucleoside-diphosphate reductase n=1 Tax=Candidatus Berkelbacteria bacterium Licking1014_85 TaxID=2017148 RepID=A0A554LIU1_9BACT|nr:MAG: ribonucleoside-diphosphate reductase alpha chain [Candidatus Berkelbacteria bacterium Licking1014_85]
MPNNNHISLDPVEVEFSAKKTDYKNSQTKSVINKIDSNLDLNKEPNIDLSIDSENKLNELGEKIFLDRYALKDASKSNINIGDKVIVCTDIATGQREIGYIRNTSGKNITVELNDEIVLEKDITDIDIPLETNPSQMLNRIAIGISRAEKDNLREKWKKRFRWILDDFKFVPAGRILAAAGTDQQLTYYNCFVIPSPKDSRGGIIETLKQMTEIFSRGGGVGINISTLRPNHAYVKGVNGRSSGSVSWGALYSFATGLIGN